MQEIYTENILETCIRNTRRKFTSKIHVGNMSGIYAENSGISFKKKLILMVYIP